MDVFSTQAQVDQSLRDANAQALSFASESETEVLDATVQIDAQGGDATRSDAGDGLGTQVDIDV
ncbi:MAG: hypothetical protein V3T29_11085 [Alphaproteobacteria bacterium]